MLEGVLEQLDVGPGAPARYRLLLGSPGEGDGLERSADINSMIGKGLRLEFDGKITCCHCGRVTRKSYAEGYCYGCFRSLARCDLCVLNPVRCHFQQGTCREPAWGESFCMQPHVVYLANASGPKVGITRRGRELTRWLDQGAVQGLLVASAATRHLAGVLEAALAQHVSDRTDWRAMLQGDPAPVDLPGLRDRLRAVVEPLAAGVQWLQAPVRELTFPILRYPQRLERLRLQPGQAVAGRLVGAKGQYLLFDHGVFNVRRHRGHHLRLSCFDTDEDTTHTFQLGAPKPQRRDQMELF
ncbi:MAG: DUF2797 domain-containing protein [Pseudomonadales bacterium]